MLEGNKNFEIVRASAGSGKTFKLVLTYLECALKYEDPRYFRRILALTFTNKAAYEMKSRILEDLKKLVEGKSDKIKDLEDSLKIEQSEIIRRASLVQQAMLHNYSDISVMTIDKFINRLVKSFARDLAIEQDYKVELDSDGIVQEAVGALLDKVGEKESAELTKLLERFVEQQVREDKDAAVRQPLIKLGKNLMKESMKGVVNSLEKIAPSELEEIRQQIVKEVIAAEKMLVDVCERTLIKFEALNIPADHQISRGGLVSSLEFMISKKAPKDTGSVTLFKMFDDPTKVVKADFRGEHRGVVMGLSGDLEAVRSAMEVMMDGEFNLKKSLYKRIGLLGTLSGLVKQVNQVQIDNNVRTFDAMHESIAEIVRKNPAPYIYERLGERYNHIFIDEFQDTSVTQWLNLLVLYDHALSKNGKTLVVGDGKQAIYRFRNGDYKQLMDLPHVEVEGQGESLIEASRSLVREHENETLINNWRTGYDIVEWNNNLFESMKEFMPSDLVDVFKGHKQTPKREFPGAVHLDIFHASNKSDRVELYCDKVLERVKEYKKQGFDYGDITVLVSQNIEGAKISEKLLANKIKPMTEESLQLGRHPGPLAIIATLKWILRPSDFRQSAAIVQCLSALTADSHNPLDEAEILSKYVHNKDFKTEEMLEDLLPNLKIKSKSTLPLVPLIGHLCKEFSLTENYPSYAEGMLELAREVGGSDEGGIKALLNVWDKNGKNRSVITAKTRDSVQIMTVHKAKGLAFKVVIFMLDSKAFSDNKNHIPVSLKEHSMGSLTDVIFDVSDFKNTSVEDQKDAELSRIQLDDINKVYVALTRPVERLDVLMGFSKDPEKIKKDKLVSVSEILYTAICAMSDKEFNVGYQTNTLEGRRTSAQKDVQYTTPRQLVTGEDITQQVISPPAETLGSSPDRLSPRELGNAVHSILESIVKLSDWPRVKLALEHSYAYDAIDRNTIIERVQTILDSPQLQPHFADTAHIESERTFITKDGTFARPDRLTMTALGWTVIDYKTTKKDIKKHKAQLLAYVDLISEIEASPTKGLLVYTDPFEIVEL